MFQIRRPDRRRARSRRGQRKSSRARGRLVLEQLEDRSLLTAVPVGPQFFVNEILGLAESAPATAVLYNSGLDAGAFLVSWQSFEQDGSGFGVYAKLFHADGSYIDVNTNGLDDDAFLVNTVTLGNQLAPTVASDGAGNFIIAWQGEDRVNGGYDIYYRRGTFAGGMDAAAEQVVNLTTAGIQSGPSAAMDTASNFVIAWQGENPNPALGLEVYARLGTYADGLQRGGVATSEILVNETTAGDQSAPSVAAVPVAGGNFVIAWQGQTVAESEEGTEEEGAILTFAKLYTSNGTVIDPEGTATGEFLVSAAVVHDQVVPAVAVNAAGTVVVAWQAEGIMGSGSDVFARRFDMTGHFLDAADLPVNQTTREPQRAPAIGIAANGEFLVSWQTSHQDGFSWAVFARHYDALAQAGNEFQVNDVTVSGPQTAPGVVTATTADGRTVIAWLGPRVPEHGEEVVEGEGGHSPAVHARLFDGAGTTALGSEFLVNLSAGLEDRPASVARDAAGNFVVVWESWEDVGDGSGLGVYARRFFADGTPMGSAFLVNTTTAGNQGAPSVAMDALGNFVVTWESDEGTDGDGYGIYYQRFDAAGNRFGGETRVNADVLGDQTAPAVATDTLGNFAIAWQGPDQSGSGIFLQRYLANGAVNGPQVQVNTSYGLDQVGPALAMNDAGQFALAWVSDHPALDPTLNDTEKSVFVRWFDASGNPAGLEYLVHQYTADGQEHPAIGMAANGDIVVTWQSINQERNVDGGGTSWGVYARQFRPDGSSPQGMEFRINQTTDGPQRYPAIAVAPEGNFAVAWQSIRQDAASWAVLQRQYAADATPLTPEEIVNTWEMGPQTLAQIALVRDDSGDYGVFWVGQGPDHVEGVHGRLYDELNLPPEPPEPLFPGDLDPTFGIGGLVVTDFLGGTDEAHGIVVQPDGKILVVGYSSVGDEEEGGGGRPPDTGGGGGGGDAAVPDPLASFALARYLPNGALDATFGVGGKVVTDVAALLNGVPEEDKAFEVAVQADGKIVVAGYVNNTATGGHDFVVLRYNSDGTLDDGSLTDSTPGDSFGTNGIVVTDFGLSDEAYDLALLPDGRILVAGRTGTGEGEGATADFALARYLTDGMLDPTFGGGDGLVASDLAGGSKDEGKAIDLMPDGRIVMVGLIEGEAEETRGGPNFAVARFLADGTLDTTFGGDGVVVTDFGNSPDEPQDVIVQPDGKVIVIGHVGGPSDFGLARYDLAGNLDPTFGNGGKTITDISGSADFPFAVELQADGRIVVVGRSIVNGAFQYAVARYTTNGLLDTEFGNLGKVVTDFGGPEPDQAYAVALQGVRIIAAGVAGSDFGLAAYLSVGTAPPDGSVLRTTYYAVGAGAGAAPHVIVYDALTGAQKFSFMAYAPTYLGGVRVAVGDVTGDAIDDIITGAAVNSHVMVFDGATGAAIRSFMAYEGFTGGVYVAAGDVTGDGRADIITGAEANGHVKVFDAITGQAVRSFLAYPGWTGSVTVAAGDVDGDGLTDIVTGAGTGAASHVKAFSAATGAELLSFMAFGGFNGGVFVAAGDTDGDGRADVIVGAGPGAGPHVKVFSGATAAELHSFMAFDPTLSNGTRVGATDLDGDGYADLLVGPGPDAPPHVRGLDGLTLAELDNFFAFAPGFLGGIYLGGSAS